jgi:hypothetical protein
MISGLNDWSVEDRIEDRHLRLIAILRLQCEQLDTMWHMMITMFHAAE